MAKSHSTNKKICFVGIDNYPVLNPDCSGANFGGESVQQVLLAKAFVELGYEVSMVVGDQGQKQGEFREGIRVWKAFSENAGLPVVRFIHPRFTSVWHALKLADADIYYQSCAGVVTGYVGRFCQKYGRQFVFRLAHDSDCTPGEQLIKYWRDRRIYEYGLRHADMIAAQGVNQVSLLRQHYALESTPVNMAVELPSDSVIDKTHRDIDVLWVNNIRDFKRPDLLIDVARQLPQYRFVMIGGKARGFEHLFQTIDKQAKTLGNVEFLGAVPYHKVNNYFLRAKLFLNTSDQEGFPNSFLQAWIRRTPVVSFFDPDGLIAAERMGSVPDDVASMVDSITNLLTDEGLLKAAADRAREFTLANYSPLAVAHSYGRLLNLKVSP